MMQDKRRIEPLAWGAIPVVIVAGIAFIFLISAYWWIFLAVGGVLTAASFFIPQSNPVPSGEIILAGQKENTSMISGSSGSFIIPQNWDPADIGIQVRRLQPDSSLVKIFVDSVVNRFIVGQDSQTAKVRIEFLKSKLEELKLSKELQASLDDLAFRSLNLEIQQLELNKKKSGLQMETARQLEILELERKRDTLKLKLEIAGLEKQIIEVNAPVLAPAKAAERSPEEIKREKKQQIERDIEGYEKESREIRSNSLLPEDTKRRRENIISKKLEALYEELEKYA